MDTDLSPTQKNRSTKIGCFREVKFTLAVSEVVSLPVLDGLRSLGSKKERGNKPIGPKEISEKKDSLTLPQTNSSPLKIY